MPRFRTVRNLALIPLLVFLMACSSGDDDTTPSPNDPPAATGGSNGAAPPGVTGSSGVAPSDSTGSSNVGGTGAADGSDILANCPELLGFYSAFASGTFGNPAAGGFTDDFSASAEVFQTAAANAPDEIRPDMQIVADALSDFYKAIDEAGIDLTDPASFASLDVSQLAQFQEVFSAFDDAALEEAADNVDAWFIENCE